jgi:hypothetical protein
MNTNPTPVTDDDDDLPSVQSYQDDLDTDDTKVDEATHDVTDDPSEVTIADREELKEGLSSIAFDDEGRPEMDDDDRTEGTGDDMREAIEDGDEDTGDPTK